MQPVLPRLQHHFRVPLVQVLRHLEEVPLLLHRLQQRAHRVQRVLSHHGEGAEELLAREAVAVKDLDLLENGALPRVPRSQEEELGDGLVDGAGAGQVPADLPIFPFI